MKRKVVKQGHNAMTITLPANWVKEQKINAGDELDIEIQEKDLVIKKTSSEGTEKAEFKMVGNAKYLHRQLAVLYRLGYDEIKIEFDSPMMIDKIHHEIEGMPGFEIIDQGENYCIVKNIASGLEREFDNILRKIFLNIIYCGEQSLGLMKKNKLEGMESLRKLSRVNNRQTNFCERMLKKEGYKDYKKTTLVYVMVWSLEQVEDYYTNIFDYLLSKKNVKINNEILNIYEDVNKLFEFYYELFYSAFDSSKVSGLKEKCLDMINCMKNILENKKLEGKNLIILLNLNLITERIYHMTECLI